MIWRDRSHGTRKSKVKLELKLLMDNENEDFES